MDGHNLSHYYDLAARIELLSNYLPKALKLVLRSKDQEQIGARWNTDNLLGTIAICSGMTTEAENSFNVAITQCDLWLSRCPINYKAHAARGLALAGKAACGVTDCIKGSEKSYLEAFRILPDAGAVAVRIREFEALGIVNSDPNYSTIFNAITNDKTHDIKIDNRRYKMSLEKLVNEGNKFDDAVSSATAFARHVCQVLVPTIKGQEAIGTGFLVGSDLVLTCYHVVDRHEVNDVECRFDVRLNDLGEAQFGPKVKVAELLSWRRYSKVELEGYSMDSTEHPRVDELDFALLHLTEKVGFDDVEIYQNTTVKRDWLLLPHTLPDSDPEKPVSIVQHPAGGEQKTASGNLLDKQPDNGARTRYLVNTLSGSSGSPVFQWSNHSTYKLLLVAMHNYGDPSWIKPNKAFNHGIPLHLVYQDIISQHPELEANLNEDLHMPDQDKQNHKSSPGEAKMKPDVSLRELFSSAILEAFISSEFKRLVGYRYPDYSNEINWSGPFNDIAFEFINLVEKRESLGSGVIIFLEHITQGDFDRKNNLDVKELAKSVGFRIE